MIDESHIRWAHGRIIYWPRWSTDPIRTAEEVTLLTTAVAFSVTIAVLEAYPFAHEHNPVTDWFLVNLGYAGTAAVTFAGLVSIYALFRYLARFTPRTAVFGACFVAFASMADAGWNVFRVARMRADMVLFSTDVTPAIVLIVVLTAVWIGREHVVAVLHGERPALG